jgi:hypothetical protein
MSKFANTDIDIADIGVEYNTARVIKARNTYIRQCVDKGAKFIGRVRKEDIREDDLKRMDKYITGKEIWIEYFAFEINGIPIVNQWRFTGS